MPLNNLNLEELNGLSNKLEQAIKAELQNALLRGMSDEDTKTSLEKSLSGLPEQVAQSLAPVFNIIGAIVGPRITGARKQKVIDQINAQGKQEAEKEED